MPTPVLGCCRGVLGLTRPAEFWSELLSRLVMAESVAAEEEEGWFALTDS